MRILYPFLLAVFTLCLITSATAQWSSGIVPYFRNGNAVVVFDNYHAAIAGGNETNDSIQSVFMSGDRAVNWMVNWDVIAPWLKSFSFASSQIGVAVGYDGAIIRTTDGGATWAAVTAPGNTANRHFNSVYFATNTVGYIAGGWPSDDSIQTILKTTDGGATWSIQRDGLGYWLKSIHFSDADNGIAVGDHGTVLKTTDGGATWSVVPLTGNIGARNYNAVYAIDNNTAIAVGGNKSNDSIQTIIKTTDGGTNWNIIKDNPDPMLNGIDFANATIAYAVGDRGTVLKSDDQGSTWTSVAIPASVNDTLNLNAVSFVNVDFGLAVGESGKMLIYENPLPTVPTLQSEPVSDVTGHSATLNVKANANGSFAAVSFEYGTTPQLGSVLTAVPDTVWGSAWQHVSVSLQSLTPDILYYYRAVAVNAGGMTVDTVRQFYSGECEIPNCSFESWDSAVVHHPLMWNFVGLPRPVPSYDGSTAVELTTTQIHRPSAVLLGEVTDGPLALGGIPINVQPDSLVFYAKYAIIPGDSALALLMFRRNGQQIHQELFPITGTTIGAFRRLSFPIHFPDATVPDSVVIGIANSWPFREDDCPNSMLTIDKVQLIGAATPFPNFDFEQWATDTVAYPVLWQAPNMDDGSAALDRVVRTTDRVAGEYALKLVGRQGSDITKTGVTNGALAYNVPTFRVAGKHNTLNFYLKYLQSDRRDTATISMAFFQGGNIVGGVHFICDSTFSDYTPFVAPIFYTDTGAMPDSANLMITIGQERVYADATLYIDNLSFDGFAATNPTAIKLPLSSPNKFEIYPNPAREYVDMDWHLADAQPSTIVLSDIDGRVVRAMTNAGDIGSARWNIGNLSAGFYLLTLRSGTLVVNRKLIISR